MLRSVAILLIGMVVILGSTTSPAQEKKIVMTPVKYDGLKQEVLKHRGKVVLVDFWATWCIPCRKAFPKIIEMQEKHGPKGLVVLAVSMDDLEKPATVESVNKFLTTVNSPFRNLLLDEPFDVWTRKFDIKGLPCYFVFDRRGKWVRYRSDDHPGGIPYDELEKSVVQMLSEK